MELSPINRREFVVGSVTIAAGTVLFGPSVLLGTSPVPDVSVVRDEVATTAVRTALELLGGMSRYVQPGDVVVVKPNIGWDTKVGFGADTNPQVVAEIVRLCLEVGAKKVKVFDNTCNKPKRCYHSSGIEEAAKAAGASVSFVHEQRFDRVDFPEGKHIKSWLVYRDALPENRDVLINVPVLKHHSLPKTRNNQPGLSIGLKNLMGVMGGDRGQIHNGFEDKLVDFCSVIRADLTIIDATSVLRRNGPRGGRKADVERLDTIIAGADPVAVDAWGVTTFGYPPADLDYLMEAHRRGLGEIDLSKVVTVERG